LAAALSIALVGGTFFSWRYAIKAERLARLATKERDWADEKMEQSLRLLYYNQINMAEREWSSGNLEAADDLLKKCEPQRRGWEWHYLDRAVNSELVNLQISNVLAFTFSQDGKYLATVGFDLKETGMVSLRDPVTGVKTKTLLSPDATNRLFAALAFSGNGHRLAALGSKLWGSPSIERIKSALFRSPLPLNSRLEWLLDVKNDPSPLVVIWDIDTAKVIRSFTVGKGCQNVELDHDGEYLLICPENGPIQAVETLSGRRLPTMGSAPASISPDGKHMLAHTGNLKPQIFPVGTSLPAIPLSPLETKFYLAKKLCLFSPNGRLIAYSHADAVGIFDAKSCQRLHNIVCGSEVQSLAFSGDSQNLAIMEKTRIKVWNINEAREVWKVRGYFDNLTMPATPRFTISFLPNGYHIALLHSHGKNPSNESIKIWDIRQAANPTKLTIPWGRAVNEIVFSRDGKLVAALGSVDRTIRETPAIGAAYGNIGIWDTHQGYKIKEFMVDNSKENLQKNFTMFAFSPDAKYFAFCSNRTMQVWEFNSSSPKSIISCKESLYYINQMYWSSNGITWVETNGLVNVWNPLTEKTPKVLSLTPTNERVCMFNERQLVFFKPKVLQIWNLFPARMFKELKWPEGSRRPWLVADRFEEMKPMPAIIFNEHNMTIYDLQKGDVMCQCVNVAEPWQISSSWFSTSTDFSRLAIVNKDNAVRIWDIRSGNNVLTLRGHKKQVHYARFSVNGHMLATASDDEIHIYNGAPKRNIDGIAP
jgi:WD40 repeat protein